jgi:RNA methyltransferase, TrmH family
MFLISSTANPKVKAWSALKSAKARKEQALLLVEGANAVDEAYRAGLAVEAIVLLEQPMPLIEYDAKPWVRDVAVEKVYVVPAFVMAKLTDTVSVPPVVGIFRVPATPKRGALTTEQGLPLPQEGAKLLVLDGLQDPGNVGGLLRTALAFGVTHCLQLAPCVDGLSPKVIRASTGLVFRMNSYQTVRPTVEALTGLQQSGWNVVITSSHEALGGTVPLSRWHPQASQATALVLGAEGSGVRLSESEAQAFESVTIPMSHETGVESLNVGVSGGILLSHWLNSTATSCFV